MKKIRHELNKLDLQSPLTGLSHIWLGDLCTNGELAMFHVLWNCGNLKAFFELIRPGDFSIITFAYFFSINWVWRGGISNELDIS